MNNLMPINTATCIKWTNHLKDKLPKLILEEIDNVHIPITNKEMYILYTNLPIK